MYPYPVRPTTVRCAILQPHRKINIYTPGMRTRERAHNLRWSSFRTCVTWRAAQIRSPTRCDGLTWIWTDTSITR